MKIDQQKQAMAQFVSTKKHLDQSGHAPSDLARLYHLSEAYIAGNSLTNRYSNTPIAVEIAGGQRELPITLNQLSQQISELEEALEGNSKSFFWVSLFQGLRAESDIMVHGLESALGSYLSLLELIRFLEQKLNQAAACVDTQYIIDEQYIEALASRLSEAQFRCAAFSEEAGPAHILLDMASEIAKKYPWRRSIIALTYAEIGDTERACRATEQVIRDDDAYGWRWIPEVINRISERHSIQDALPVAERFRKAGHDLSTSVLIEASLFRNGHGEQFKELPRVIEELKKWRKTTEIYDSLIHVAQAQTNHDKVKLCLNVAAELLSELSSKGQLDRQQKSRQNLQLAVAFARNRDISRARSFLRAGNMEPTGFFAKKLRFLESGYIFSSSYYAHLALSSHLVHDNESEALSYLEKAKKLYDEGFSRDPESVDAEPLIEAFLAFEDWVSASKIARYANWKSERLTARIIAWLLQHGKYSEADKLFSSEQNINVRRNVLEATIHTQKRVSRNDLTRLYEEHVHVRSSDQNLDDNELTQLAFLAGYFCSLHDLHNLKDRIKDAHLGNILHRALEGTLMGDGWQAGADYAKFLQWAVSGKRQNLHSVVNALAFPQRDYQASIADIKDKILSAVEAEKVQIQHVDERGMLALCAASQGRVSQAFRIACAPDRYKNEDNINVLCAIAAQL